MNEILTSYEVIFDLGLYRRLPLADDDDLRWLTHAEETFDAYCWACQATSVFRKDKPNETPQEVRRSIVAEVPLSEARRVGLRVVSAVCARESAHRVVCFLAIDEGGLTKIGQQPSIADLKISRLSEYDRVLSPDDRADLARAEGLFAHGIGIGSFVYLRRILERMVQAEEAKLPTAAPANGSVVDRIKSLKGALPAFLVDNSFLYSVLSKGIHELSEDDCLLAFPVVIAAIEQILADHLSAVLQAQQRNRAAKELGDLNAKLGSKRPPGAASHGNKS